jgi:hypothetical protein
LTIKFTQHRAASPPLSAIRRQPAAKPPHAAQILSATRLLIAVIPFERISPEQTGSRFTQPCICPIYSVVKHRPPPAFAGDRRLGGL